MRIILLVLICLASIPLTFRRPVLGLAFYLGANIIRPEMLFWSTVSANFVFKLWIGLLFIIIFTNNYQTRFKRLACKEIYLMLALIIGIVMSTMLSQYVGGDTDYEFTIEIFKHIVFCSLIVIIVNDLEDVIFLQRIMLGCLTFMGVWGILQSFSGNERLEGLGGAAWPDSNFVAAIFVLFLPVALAYLYSAEGKKNLYLGLTMFMIMAFLVICTKSRAGTLGMIVCILAFGYFAGKMKSILAMFALLALIITPFIDESYFSRMNTMKNQESIQGDSSAQTRLVLWQSALLVFRDNPFFGTGFFTFPDAKFKYKNDFMNVDDGLWKIVFREERKFVTHNTYLQMLSDCGLFGALPFFILIFLSVKHGFTSRNMLKTFPEKSKSILWLSGISAGICGYAVCIFTLNAITIFMMYAQIIFASLMFKMLDELISHQGLNHE